MEPTPTSRRRRARQRSRPAAAHAIAPPRHGSFWHGIAFVLIGHLLVTCILAIPFGPLAPLLLIWFVPALVQPFYVLPLLLVLTLTRRHAAALGALVTAALSYVPVELLRASDLKVIPF